MRRVLKPGGRLELVDIVYPNDQNWLDLDLSPGEYYQAPLAHARRLYDVYLNSLEGAPTG